MIVMYFKLSYLCVTQFIEHDLSSLDCVLYSAMVQNVMFIGGFLGQILIKTHQIHTDDQPLLVWPFSSVVTMP